MGELSLVVGMLLAGYSIYLIVSSIMSSDEEQKALSWATGDEPTISNSKFLEFSRPLVHKFGLALASKIKSPAYRKRIEQKIFTSGLQAELNVDEFIGLQVVWGLLFPVMLLVLNFTLELGFPEPLCVLMGLGGIYFPHLHCKNEKTRRNKKILIDLPFYIDLLALSIEAGADFISAIEKVVEKAESSPLAQEFDKVLRDIKIGSTRADALKKMAARLDMAEVTSFVTMFVDADAVGGEIGKVLKSQSIQMRMERFTRAEKQGAKVSQMILVPLMIFIIPAVFILVFGPVILQFMGQGG